MVASVELTQSKERTYPQWITAVIANTALLTYGLQAGWVSPGTKFLQSTASPLSAPITPGELSWIASVLCIAAMLATPVYSYIADAHGRRIAISIVAGFQALSWIIKVSASTANHIIIARVICGLSCGGCFNVIPSYTKDISQDHIRGLLGSLVIFFQNIGILTMYALGVYLDYYKMVWSVMWLPWVTMVLIWFVPESPEFLVKKGRTQEAVKAVAFLRGLEHDDKLVASEVARLGTAESHYASLPPITYATIWRDRCYRRYFFIVMAMILFQSLNGNYAVLMYAGDILASSGVTFSPELQTLSFPAILIVGSVVSIICVEKLGRKVFLAANFLVASLSLTVLAATMLHQHLGGQPPGWLPATTIVLGLFTYAAGILPLPYIIMTEMLNFQIRCKILGVVVSYAWFISFIQLMAFVPISNAVGMYSTFFFFAAVNLIGGVVCLVVLPETRGKSTEEIEALFRKDTNQAKQ